MRFRGVMGWGSVVLYTLLATTFLSGLVQSVSESILVLMAL